jgi:microcystin degradation protein MlrC
MNTVAEPLSTRLRAPHRGLGVNFAPFVALILAGCTGGEQRPGDVFRVAVIRYQHETCTFCPGGDTEIEDWTRIRPPLQTDEVLESGEYIEGFVHQAEAYGDVEPVGITSPYEVFGGSSRSWNSEESFEHFLSLILADLRSRMPVDGVHLALHGAMAVRNVPRPEAEIARRVREVVGADVPIVGTFDLHGNEDGEFLRWADGAFVVKRFPHYDAYIQGERAARYMREMMKGRYVPTTASRKPPIITATVLQWTGASPAMDIMERARRWEARQPGAYVSVFFGYPWSDVPDVGATVHVMTNDDRQLADRIADDMAEFIWRVREDFAHGEFPMPEEAVRRTGQAIAAGATPVVLGDYSDRPGDATWILQQLIDQGVSGVLYAALRDERALDALAERGAAPGDPFDMEVGGFTGPQAGAPVRITGTVQFFGPMDPYERVAAIAYGDGNVLILAPAYTQITTPDYLRFGPVDPDAYDVFVLKSRAHFRRGFDETGYAKTILVVDAPGPWIGTTRLDALDYQYAPIDRLYPFGRPETVPGG